METIDDIRREQGNPRHGEVGGPPRSVNRFFGEASALKFVALLFLILAALLIAFGVFTLVFPIAYVGFAALLVAVFVYVRSRNAPVD